jgi:periodic tryptophan protein 2
LHRYCTFKTLTTPAPVQFLCLAVNPSGEVVAAGAADPFHIYVWNLQTGKLLDVLTGHPGPVCDLVFQSNSGMLASVPWDGTVKLKETSRPKMSNIHRTWSVDGEWAMILAG